MKRTITLGAIEIPLSTVGTSEPIDIPNAVEAIDSMVKMPKNFSKRPGAGLRPQKEYMMIPEMQGNIADNGTSASNLLMK